MTGTISIGGILSDTVRAYRLDPITLSIVMAIIMAVPVVLMELYLIPLLSEPDNLEEDFTDPGTLAAVIGLYLIIILAYSPAWRVLSSAA